MASPSLRDDFDLTVELYSTFIKQMKAENPQLNVSEVSFARGKGAKTRLVSEVPLEFQMFQMLLLMTVSLRSINIMLSPLSRRICCVSSPLKCGHVGNGHGGNGNGNGKDNGRGPMIKSPTRSIAALATKFEKINLPDDDYDESSEEDKVPPTSQMLP
jgi:hypothetical protein